MDIDHFSSTNRESDTGSFNNKHYLDGGYRIRKRHIIELALELGAGVKQQPPMHQFRMRPFKPFWG
jgi:hypothetical protein